MTDPVLTHHDRKALFQQYSKAPKIPTYCDKLPAVVAKTLFRKVPDKARCDLNNEMAEFFSQSPDTHKRYLTFKKFAKGKRVDELDALYTLKVLERLPFKHQLSRADLSLYFKVHRQSTHMIERVHYS
jgi:hypothetical protein